MYIKSSFKSLWTHFIESNPKSWQCFTDPMSPCHLYCLPSHRTEPWHYRASLRDSALITLNTYYIHSIILFNVDWFNDVIFNAHFQGDNPQISERLNNFPKWPWNWVKVFNPGLSDSRVHILTSKLYFFLCYNRKVGFLIIQTFVNIEKNPPFHFH